MSSASELKRQRILEAATTLFGEHGYAANMDSIAKLADVSKQTVYSHFKTKDILFEICMETKCLEFQADEGMLDLTKPMDEALLQFAQGLQEILLNPGAIHTFRNAVSNIDNHPEFAATYLRLGPQQSTDVLGDYLQNKHNTGEIKLDISAQESAAQLLLMFHGKPVYWKYLGEDLKQSKTERDTYLKSCIAMFLSFTRN
ncbi:TetR family transcriptional regulator [Vibrio sp. 10N.286.49.C2]|uniref:TetR/AcrR family transcriptional regulator n=1 Tax=unclassified Vibrio TaxID=2614977 RepID=UPI000C85E4DB|nr:MULTISPECIES: TetR/AcrR family transcriptional regulator [unclassified Vibrio]PMH39323.1 TetR family transcriptional regulator [Vibrio sp. 10N.286.49.C2]PMH54327.1 TetR family transcriptional regulator [Vibrio sp. 10N.286.49.B1]PMH81456.1 TetR family transcriptional regulator [Vibrio sp. 10N.286.48.B7]